MIRVKSATVFYLLYSLPGQLNLNFKYIASRKIGNSEYTAKTLAIEKGSAAYHSVAGIAGPSIAFWFVAFLLIYSILIKNRSRLNVPVIRRQFLYMYECFKGSRFYWDSILVAVKISLIFINTYLN